MSVSLDFGMAGREVVRWYVDFFGLGGLGGGVNPYFLIEMNVQHISMSAITISMCSLILQLRERNTSLKIIIQQFEPVSSSRSSEHVGRCV